MLEEEHLLIVRSAAGDGEAFGALYGHYHPKIYRFVYLKVGRKEEAEDLTHQVFLHAWEHMPGYRHEGHPLSSWLYRIARNAIIDHYRTRRANLALDDLDAELIAAGERLEDAADAAMAIADIRAAMAKLKPSYQDVIILRFVEELSLKETAQALGKSEGAVKLLQHRATKDLQKLLEKNSKSANEPLRTPETA